MAVTHHGGLPTAVLHGHSPSPYTSVTGNLNLLQKIWSKSMVHSPDPSKDTLQRCITTVPPSITTTHHDGGLPSPLSYTLANDNPPHPSMPTQCSRQNLRDKRLFWNDRWTKWEAMQLADELEAKQEMVKADWECWKKLEEQIEQIHRPFFLFGQRWPRRSLSVRKDKREMECWPIANCKRDGHVTLLPISLPRTVWVLHQELCSKEME